MMDHSGETRGNGAVAVLIHDESAEALEALEKAVLAALRHFGIPFRLYSTSGLPDGFFASEGASLPIVLLPQTGSLARLSASALRDLARAVRSGLGLVAYDSRPAEMPADIRSLAGLSSVDPARAAFRFLVTESSGHYVGRLRTVGERLEMDAPLECGRLPADVPLEERFLAAESGWPLVRMARAGEGRVVLFPFDARLYAMEHLGHACGMDDVFTRSIVWAARKPFLTYFLPPFAGLGIDDCSGSYNHFRYVDTLNAHGWKPSLCVFADAVDEVAHENAGEDAKKLREGVEAGSLEVVFHALRYNESFCFDHLGRKPLGPKDLADRFARWDHYEQKWGIKHGPWAHPHFGEIGRNAIPFFRQRGIRFLTWLLPFDAGWFDVPDRVPPLPPFPPFGHFGYYMHDIPEFPGLTTFESILDRKTRDSTAYVPKTDYLWNNTVFWDEAPDTRLEEAARTAAEQVRRGIDAGFYGEAATHEQRIACLKPAEWKALWQEVEGLLARHPLEHRRLSDCMDYMKRRSGTALSSVEKAGGELRYGFTNGDCIGTRVQVHADAPDGGVETRQHEIRSQRGTVGGNAGA